MHRRERGIERGRGRDRERGKERERKKEREEKNQLPVGRGNPFLPILHPARIPGSHTRVTDMKLMGPYGMQLLLHRA